MRKTICTIVVIVGGFVTELFDVWDSALVTLIIFMSVDFVTGLVTSAMGKSKHSKNGSFNSSVCWIGLAKKFCVLLLIMVAVRIDTMLGTVYICDAVCIKFCINELLSIIENTSLIGIPYPSVIKNAISVLQKKAAQVENIILNNEYDENIK